MHSYGYSQKTTSSTQRKMLVVFWEYPCGCAHFKDVAIGINCLSQSSVDTGLVAHRWLVRVGGPRGDGGITVTEPGEPADHRDRTGEPHCHWQIQSLPYLSGCEPKPRRCRCRPGCIQVPIMINCLPPPEVLFSVIIRPIHTRIGRTARSKDLNLLFRLLLKGQK